MDKKKLTLMQGNCGVKSSSFYDKVNSILEEEREKNTILTVKINKKQGIDENPLQCSS